MIEILDVKEAKEAKLTRLEQVLDEERIMSETAFDMGDVVGMHLSSISRTLAMICDILDDFVNGSEDVEEEDESD